MSFVLLIGKNKLALYPSLTEDLLSDVANALCPFHTKLPIKVKEQIEKTCEEFLKFKKETATSPWSDSVLNSLDFHYSDEKLKIIEANTNASGFLLSNLLLEDDNEIPVFEKSLFESFKGVLKARDLKHIFISDKDPEGERMFAEFLMFKDFFKRFDVKASVVKTKDVKIKDSKIYLYNRDTDFYLEKNMVLKALWETGQAVLSTNPNSYQNIADKKYSVDSPELLKESRFTNLKESTLETYKLDDTNRDDLWTRRKSFFFKPSSSFGSKGVYAGKSVSRKKFDAFEDGYLAQELHLPGKIVNGDDEWKFDIRAYFSEKGVQKVLARVYKGQLTNFSSPGGGFALIKWVD